jgi:hypothetical protein
MADDLADKTKDISQQLDKASKSMQEISKYQKGIIKGFTDITKQSSAIGQAWVAVARFFSGTGFWKIQNKVKALSNALQFMQKLDEKRLKAENERMVLLANEEDNKKNLIALQKKLLDYEADTLDYSERKALSANNLFKLLKSEHGTRNAILILTKRTAEYTKKAEENEENSGKIRAKNFLKMEKLRENLHKKIGRVAPGGKLHDKLTEELTALGGRSLPGSRYKDYKKYTTEGLETQLDIEELEEKQRIRKSDRDAVKKDIKLLERRLTLERRIREAADKAIPGGLKKGSAAYYRERDELRAAGGELSSSEMSDLKDLKKDDKRLGEEYTTNVDDLKELKTKRADLAAAGELEKGTKDWKTIGAEMFMGSKESREKWGLRYEKLKEKASAMWSGLKKITDGKEIMNGIKNTFSKKNMKAKAEIVTQGLRFIGMAFLWFAMIILFLLFLKQIGVITWIVNFAKEIMKQVPKIIEKVSKFITALFAFGFAFWDFIVALFTGDEVMGKLGVMLEKLGKLVLAGLLLMGKLLGFLVEAAVAALGTMWNNAMQWLSEKTGATKKEAGLWGGMAAGALLGMRIGMAGGVPGMLVGIGVGGLVGAGVGYTATAATGGKIQKGGWAIVGERGPELVNLPTGANVYSNSASSRATGSTVINVNINGRLGASDSELREISQKVGRMISLEMNRSTSTLSRVV